MLKKKFQYYFQNVQTLINEFDPCSLIILHCPKDEYDCLTTKIVKMLIDGNSSLAIKKLFIHEIQYHFGTPDLKILDKANRKKFNSDLNQFIEKVQNLKTLNNY